MTSKQVSDSNNQQINDLHRLIKKYHAIRNIVKILTVPINIKPQFTFQNLNCKKYDHEVSHHKKSVKTIHMVWMYLKLWRYENEYLRIQHINLEYDLFLTLQKDFHQSKIYPIVPRWWESSQNFQKQVFQVSFAAGHGQRCDPPSRLQGTKKMPCLGSKYK